MSAPLGQLTLRMRLEKSFEEEFRRTQVARAHKTVKSGDRIVSRQTY